LNSTVSFKGKKSNGNILTRDNEVD
jgi:hypothetical protein